MTRIELPDLHWFVNRYEGRFLTNTFSGSLGTSAGTGCLRVRTFHFRVFMDVSSSNEETFRLIAKAYVLQPWHLGGDKTDVTSAAFEGTVQGISEAEQWLVQTIQRLGFPEVPAW